MHLYKKLNTTMVFPPKKQPGLFLFQKRFYKTVIKSILNSILCTILQKTKAIIVIIEVKMIVERRFLAEAATKQRFSNAALPCGQNH